MMHWLWWVFCKLPFRPERPGGVAFERHGFSSTVARSFGGVTFERAGFTVTIQGPIT